jgi:hypothetical protein
MIKQLKLENSRKSVLVIVEETDRLGATIAIDPIDSYLIILKPQSLMSLGTTLGHEMTHVKQMATGLLREGKNHTMWCGKRYKKNTPYLEQPWELQAFAKQEILFRRAIEM